VAATVGKEKISGKRINKIVSENLEVVNAQIQNQMANIPADRRASIVGSLQIRVNALPGRIRSQMIFQALLRNFIRNQKIQASDADLAEVKQRLANAAKAQGITVQAMMKRAGITDAALVDEARIGKFRQETLAPEKIALVIKDNPSYFNGTKVQASHILITCEPTASTAKQKAIVTKLEKIAADIKAGKTTFGEAAKKFSSCPSKAKGGDLGEFTFDKMVPTFSVAAFALKPGELSGIVHTAFGFHIIKVTKRVEGKDKVDPKLKKNKKLAEAILLSNMNGKIVAQALSNCPIVVMDK
jgi:peptidyl-prolyl cis-trans isomerase C